MDSGVRRGCLERQIQSLTSWVTLGSLFMNLSFLFCRRGMILLIHRIAVHITYDQRAWQVDCEGKTQRPCTNWPCIPQVLALVLAPSDSYFLPSGLFLLAGVLFCFVFCWNTLPRWVSPSHHLDLSSNVTNSDFPWAPTPHYSFIKLCFNFLKVLNPSME